MVPFPLINCCHKWVYISYILLSTLVDQKCCMLGFLGDGTIGQVCLTGVLAKIAEVFRPPQLGFLWGWPHKGIGGVWWQQ
jgi:hypothetical protein